jgi:hypothetical protein
MSMDFSVYGFEVARSLLHTGEFKESYRFPRVTLCDFQIRQLHNIQNWTIQCVLPINLFNEKIFIFIWFWLCLLSALTLMNCFAWIYRIFFKHNRFTYVKKYLTIADELHTGFDKKLARKFGDEYLRDDGIFVLRVIGKNSSSVILTDLVQHLFKLFKDSPFLKKSMPDSLDDLKESMQ